MWVRRTSPLFVHFLAPNPFGTAIPLILSWWTRIEIPSCSSSFSLCLVLPLIVHDAGPPSLIPSQGLNCLLHHICQILHPHKHLKNLWHYSLEHLPALGFFQNQVQHFSFLKETWQEAPNLHIPWESLSWSWSLWLWDSASWICCGVTLFIPGISLTRPPMEPMRARLRLGLIEVKLGLQDPHLHLLCILFDFLRFLHKCLLTSPIPKMWLAMQS